MARIVVVEDDDDIATLVVRHLCRRGHGAVHVADGSAGLAQIRNCPPDLVVLDWNLPGMDGPDICRAVRALPQVSGIPVVMLSSRNSAADVAEAITAGVDVHLSKPFRVREFVDTVELLLNGGRSSRDLP